MRRPEAKLLFQNSHNRLYFLKEINAIMICPEGIMDKEAFAEANHALLRWGEQLQVTRVILNEQMLLRMPPSSRLWLITSFLTREEVKVALKQIEDISVVNSPSVALSTLMRVLHRFAGSLIGKTFHYYPTLEDLLADQEAISKAS